jgi:hypothetical protein
MDVSSHKIFGSVFYVVYQILWMIVHYGDGGGAPVVVKSRLVRANQLMCRMHYPDQLYLK